ncbi:MAG: hypothetical protein NZ556_01545 [Fimbriimonadales bacterium]|nr:hypothetical protein [Fimbriimonadales bacterium]
MQLVGETPTLRDDIRAVGCDAKKGVAPMGATAFLLSARRRRYGE